MTDAEKIAAFDALAVSLTNHWASGHWTWWCPNPAGGQARPTREEAVADLVTWAHRNARKKRRPLAVVSQPDTSPIGEARAVN